MTLKDIMKVKGKRIERVLGIDASTNSLAFCLFTDNGPETWGEIHFKGSTAFERLSDGQIKTRALVQELNYDLIVFESAVYVQNKKTVILLAYAFGAIVSTLMHSKAGVEEISPLEWQAAIGNKKLSKADKDKVKSEYPDHKDSWYTNKFREIRKNFTKDWVKKNYGITVDSDNVSDAIAIASTGHSKYAKPSN